MNPDLTVDIAGLKMKNPVMVASGTFGYGEEYAQLVDLNSLGAIVVKGITLAPRLGNPPPRIVETPCGMLNAIGLENVGVEKFIKEKLPYLRQFDIIVIANIAGKTVEEYVELARKLNGLVDGLEINISCPNVVKGGLEFGQDPALTYEVVSKVRQATRLPLIAKLSPNVTDIKVIAKSAVEAGIDAISLINTILGMVIDVTTRKPILANVTGGLSGPAIKPIALRMVHEVARVVRVPIIGQGGIMNATDALEFIIAGATAVAVGTANFVDPQTSLKIIKGIEDYLIKNNIHRLSELTGSLQI
ncbi:MAG: dihydroorotate dehydrogenase [bacterium]|nr:dihydroorotate dehydrogenase [bacterium]